MVPRFLFLTFLCYLFGFVLADGGRRGGDDDSDGRGSDDSGKDSATASPSSTASSASTTAASTGQASQGNSIFGDTQCSQTMCVAATVNGTQTTYVLSGLGSSKFGWMGMGFGSQMSNTPMVIMWMNNGRAILSQRSAPSEVMPTVVSSPPRIATLLDSETKISTTTPSLAYTIPSNSDTKQSIIFAYGTTDPNSASPDATLIQHLDYGILSLDLTKVLSTSSTGSGSSSGSPAVPSGVSDTKFTAPLQPYQKTIIAHAVLVTAGFLFILPAGALLARYARTFTNTWFKGHWILQFGVAAPLICIGVILGVVAVSQAKANHFDDNHKRWGIALLVLYLVQCGLGAFIHFVKKADRKRRPPQNYVHAVFGIAIIGLSLYQVHSGFDTEWPLTTGRDPVPKYVKYIFYIWAVLLPVAYAVGLSFLPKQYRQERAKVNDRSNFDQNNYLNLTETSYQYQKPSMQH
jgi:cytochrome b561